MGTYKVMYIWHCEVIRTCAQNVDCINMHFYVFVGLGTTMTDNSAWSIRECKRQWSTMQPWSTANVQDRTRFQYKSTKSIDFTSLVLNVPAWWQKGWMWADIKEYSSQSWHYTACCEKLQYPSLYSILNTIKGKMKEWKCTNDLIRKRHHKRHLHNVIITIIIIKECHCENKPSWCQTSVW